MWVAWLKYVDAGEADFKCSLIGSIVKNNLLLMTCLIKWRSNRNNTSLLLGFLCAGNHCRPLQRIQQHLWQYSNRTNPAISSMYRHITRIFTHSGDMSTSSWASILCMYVLNYWTSSTTEHRVFFLRAGSVSCRPPGERPHLSLRHNKCGKSFMRGERALIQTDQGSGCLHVCLWTQASTK